MKARDVAALAGLVGFVVPVAVELALIAHPFIANGWLMAVWPSSIMLMANEKSARSEAWLSVAVAVLANSSLYAFIGFICGWAWQGTRRPK